MEIAEAVGVTQQEIAIFTKNGKVAEFCKTDKNSQAAADHATDFEPPIFVTCVEPDQYPFLFSHDPYPA